MKFLGKITWRRFNDFLSLVIVGVAAYILILPFWPQVSLWLHKRSDKTGGYVYKNNLTPDNSKTQKPKPKENRLLLPSINLNEEIHEGEKDWTLSKGLWRPPQSSTPDKSGNTVIVGHRFVYGGAAVLYHLDKVKTGDKIVLYWQGQEHDYEVTRTFITAPSNTAITAKTTTPLLTIYTCTPLWTVEKRLVVQARPVGDIL